MRTIKSFWLLLCLCSSAWAASPLNQKYPDVLLTDDHGILKEKDVTNDLPDKKIVPYRINEDQPGFPRWQCFPVEDIKPKVQTWRGVDGMGGDQVVTMCDLHILAEGKEPWHDYFEPRAWNNNHCSEFMNAWNRLTRNEGFVCLSGDPFLLEKENVEGAERMVKLWQWNKFKTKKGCYSYRLGVCD